MRVLLLAVLATAAAACIPPRQRGTQTYVGSTPQNGGAASVGGVGQATQPVATPTGIAITSSSAALVPLAKREPVTYAVNQRSAYLIDPITHTCTLIFAAMNGPVAVPVDCGVLRTGLPQVAYLIDWLPAPPAAP